MENKFSVFKSDLLLVVANYRLGVQRLYAANGLQALLALGCAGAFVANAFFFADHVRLLVDGLTATRAVHVVVSDVSSGLSGVFFSGFIFYLLAFYWARMPERVQGVVFVTRDVLLFVSVILSLLPQHIGITALLFLMILILGSARYAHARLIATIIACFVAYLLMRDTLHFAAIHIFTVGESLQSITLLALMMHFCFLRWMRSLIA